jgi:hypothetical protein
MKTIYLEATRQTVTVASYVKAWKLAIANPNRKFSHGLNTWWPQTGAAIRKEFLRGVHDRINLKALTK